MDSGSSLCSVSVWEKSICWKRLFVFSLLLNQICLCWFNSSKSSVNRELWNRKAIYKKLTFMEKFVFDRTSYRFPWIVMEQRKFPCFCSRYNTTFCIFSAIHLCWSLLLTHPLVGAISSRYPMKVLLFLSFLLVSSVYDNWEVAVIL